MEILICLVVAYFVAGIGSILMSVGTVNGHVVKFLSLIYLGVGIGSAGIFLDQMVFVFASEAHADPVREIPYVPASNADNGMLSAIVLSAIH